MGSCGAVSWNKINSFRKSANNPRAQKKMICFFKKLNFVPSLSFSVIWAQKLVDTFQNDYEFLDFKKGWALGLFALLRKELILFQNATPQEPIL